MDNKDKRQIDNLVENENKKQVRTAGVDKTSSLKKSISISDLIAHTIAYIERRRFKPQTKKAHRNRLTKNIKDLGTVADIFAMVGVLTTADIDRGAVSAMYDIFEENVSESNYRTGVMASIRKMLDVAMDEGYIKQDKELLKLCRQEQRKNHDILIATYDELKIIENALQSKDDLVAVQMYVVIGIFMLRLGIRSAEEIVSIDIANLNTQKQTIGLVRKSGRFQTIVFPKECVPTIEHMITLRKEHLHKCGAEEEIEPLFIKIDENRVGVGKKNGWRLTRAGLEQRWRYLQKQYGLRKELKLRDFRKRCVSEQGRVARVLGLAIEDVCYHNDHSKEVQNNHYNGYIDDNSEFLGRSLTENVEFIEQNIKRVSKEIDKDPNNLALRASRDEWYRKLGRFQNEVEMIEYCRGDTLSVSFGLGGKKGQIDKVENTDGYEEVAYCHKSVAMDSEEKGSSLDKELYVSKEELAKLLSVSVKTIEKNSNRIEGRVKIGRSVRFYLPDIHRVLLSGRNLFGKN